MHDVLAGLVGLFVDDPKDTCNGLAHGFFLSPARQVFPDGVDEGNPAGGIRGYDRVTDARQRHTQPLTLLPQGLLVELEISEEKVVGLRKARLYGCLIDEIKRDYFEVMAEQVGKITEANVKGECEFRTDGSADRQGDKGNHLPMELRPFPQQEHERA